MTNEVIPSPEYRRAQLLYHLHSRDRDIVGAMPHLANMLRIIRGEPALKPLFKPWFSPLTGRARGAHR